MFSVFCSKGNSQATRIVHDVDDGRLEKERKYVSYKYASYNEGRIRNRILQTESCVIVHVGRKVADKRRQRTHIVHRTTNFFAGCEKWRGSYSTKMIKATRE